MNRRSSLLCLSFTLAACSGGEDPTSDTAGAAVEKVNHAQAALMVATNTETALMGLTNAASFLAESSTLASTLNELGGSSESCTTDYPLCQAGQTCPEPVTVCETEELTTEDLAEAEQELKDGIANLVEQLNTRLFTEDNIETQEEKAVTYILGPEDLCVADEVNSIAADGTVTTIEGELDPECVEDTNQAQPRLRVTSPSEGNVDVTVLLTSERYAPMVFELHKDRLAVTVDLDQLAASIEALGGDLESLESLEGKAQLELVKNGAKDYSVRTNVLEDVKVLVNDDGDRVEFSLGASSPTTEVRLDGNAKTISAAYNYGPIRVAGPLASFASMFDDSEGIVTVVASDGTVVETSEPAKTYTGNIEAVLAGLDGVFTFDGQKDSFSFTGIGFGDSTSTLKHNGNTLLALDVNAEQSRHFDVTIKDTTSGLEFTFSPTLDVSLLFGFRHIADQVDVPNVLMNDTLRFFFDGANPSVRARDNGLEVTSGTLHLTSTASPEYNVDVAQGMCLVGSDDVSATEAAASDALAPVPVPVEEDQESSDEHPWSGLSAGACE